MDDWIVECSKSSSSGGADFWKRQEKVRLRHAGTDKYLGGSSQVQFNAQNCGNACPIMNHLEAFARQRADDYTEFKVELGVHLSK
jgi:hypothetical protein